MTSTTDRTDLGFNVGTTIHDEVVCIEATRHGWKTTRDDHVVIRGDLAVCLEYAGLLIPEHRRTGALLLPPYRSAA